MTLSILDYRLWAAAGLAGLALSLWVASAERDAARADARAASRELAAERDTRRRVETERDGVRADLASAEADLTAYAAASAAAWRAQADASARMAARLDDIDRRARAASLEISRADSGLSLDDPLPRSLRDGLACAGGDERACAAAAPADPGGLPGRVDDAAASSGHPAGDADRA